jgi:hypothetical protein
MRVTVNPGGSPPDLATSTAPGGENPDKIRVWRRKSSQSAPASGPLFAENGDFFDILGWFEPVPPTAVSSARRVVTGATQL